MKRALLVIVVLQMVFSEIQGQSKKEFSGHFFAVFDIDIDIFVNCNWIDTRWQQYSTHLHTNSTQNNTIKLFKAARC